jgi:hypothetical protein
MPEDQLPQDDDSVLGVVTKQDHRKNPRKPYAQHISPELVEKLAEEVAEQMVVGWSLINRNEFKNRYEDKYQVEKWAFNKIEQRANEMLVESWDSTARKDLVARSLSRLEYISSEALKYKQMSVAQASVASMLRAVGVDKPAD